MRSDFVTREGAAVIPLRPAPWSPEPDGCHFEPFQPDQWITPPIGAGRCRAGAGPGRRACGRPPVATLMRTTYGLDGNPPRPWDYCADHLYGGWIEDGKVTRWRLVRDEDTA